MTGKRAIYAFSGDPITLGHIDIVERAARHFDELVVGIGTNPAKRYLFTLAERHELARRCLGHLGKVQVVSFTGLLVDYAYEQKIPVIIRGVRNLEDFNYEVLLHQIGDSQRLALDTFLLPARSHLAHVSSGAVKALQKEQGLVHPYVPLLVKQALEAKSAGQYLVGITGEIGVGKSRLSRHLCALGQARGLQVHDLDLDRIGHEILEVHRAPIYEELRARLIDLFGEGIRAPSGGIDRKALGLLVFGDAARLKLLNDALLKPLRLRRELYGKSGLVLINSALLAETEMASLCNNHVVLVRASAAAQAERLRARQMTEEQIRRRLSSQYTTAEKERHLSASIAAARHGRIWCYDSEDADDEPARVTALFVDLCATLGIVHGDRIDKPDPS